MKSCPIILSALLWVSSSIKLQAPKNDARFWNRNRILMDEPRGQWPDDAVNSPYVGPWSYWYRTKGMQTSTDDVIVAFVAAYPDLDENSRTPSISSFRKSSNAEIRCYADLGCGIGSTLLLVAHLLRPTKFSIGIEAQEQSARLLQRTLHELPNDAPDVRVAHADLRTVLMDSVNNGTESDTIKPFSILPIESVAHRETLVGRCDLITANPPYAALQTGTLCQDAQRRSARFELRGGIEDYLMTAKAMLSPSGRFVVAFWSRDDDRVQKAVESVGDLHVYRRFDVLMGEADRNDPHLSVYDIRFKHSSIYPSIPGSEIKILDITRDRATGGLNKNYEMIKNMLSCASRPLKRPVGRTSMIPSEVSTS